jgi:dynein heavy chain
MGSACCVERAYDCHVVAAAAVSRFYFVSDPTLLEILSLGSDPPSVVPHFQSGLFDSLSNVTFDKVDKTRMLEMFSQQGEKVRACQPEGSVCTSHPRSAAHQPTA